MSGVSTTGDGDRFRRAYRFLRPGRVIRSTYGTSTDISFDVEDAPALSEENVSLLEAVWK